MNARLQIAAHFDSDRTVLSDLFYTRPFKVMNVTEDKTQALLQLMIMSSSPGVLDGDAYTIDVTVAANASLQLYTQAYQRIFTMRNSASQTMQVRLEENATLIYLPHPSVPHEHSSFLSTNNFYCKPGSRLLFGEVLTCGRKLNGEQFKFTSYQSINSVFINQRLLIRENLLMQPAAMDVLAMGQLEGYTHQASLLCIGEDNNWEATKEMMIALLEAQPHIEYGISAAPGNGCIIRILGNGAELLYDLLKALAALCSDRYKQSVA